MEVARDAPEDALFGVVPGLRVFGARLSGQHMALIAAATLMLGARGLLLGGVIWVVYTLSQGGGARNNQTHGSLDELQASGKPWGCVLQAACLLLQRACGAGQASMSGAVLLWEACLEL